MKPGKTADLEAVAAELWDWSSQHDLVKVAIASARVSLHNYAQEETAAGLKPALDYEQLLLEFDKQSLVFKSGILSYVYIDTQIGLYLRDEAGVHFRGLKPVGYYRLITLPNGRVENDYLVFDPQHHI